VEASILLCVELHALNQSVQLRVDKLILSAIAAFAFTLNLPGEDRL